MTDTTITNELASTLEWLRTTAESSTDFITQQAPLYAQELLAYGMWSSMAWVCLFLPIALVCVLGIRWAVKEDSDEELAGPCFFLSGALLFIVSGGLFTQALDIIMIQTAPRVYILENLPQILS